ncbi:uncharacterized protein [Ambystoma mexicanum]|uniref:uncharacterized protein isoform X2 n=1 Tax=Ambystoma mexicanum TaxID=8296 RepID=UPI0037E89453
MRPTSKVTCQFCDPPEYSGSPFWTPTQTSAAPEPPGLQDYPDHTGHLVTGQLGERHLRKAVLLYAAPSQQARILVASDGTGVTFLHKAKNQKVRSGTVEGDNGTRCGARKRTFRYHQTWRVRKAMPWRSWHVAEERCSADRRQK